ncbi:MAG: hypothetical protein ABI175_14555 [Polyangiales bacterium]
MNIKAQGLLNAAKWIEAEFGQGALRDVIRACSVEVRDRYTSAIAINWHPMEEFVEFLEVADRILGRGDGRIAEEIGAAGARKNMKGAMLRLVFYLAKPEFLMKRITQLWRQFNDEGSMDLLHLDDYSSSIEVRGVTNPQFLFCATLTGWSREVAIALGGANPVVRHTECRARGASKCIWQLRWTGASTTQMVQKNTPPSVFPPPPPPSSTTASSGRQRATDRATEPKVPAADRAPSSTKIPQVPPVTRKKP